MSETRATTPVFPPGRYGRRRSPRRRPRLIPIMFAIVVLAGSVLLAVRLYDRWGDPDHRARIVGWSTVSASRMSIEFAVRVPGGGRAECILRARAYDGSEVGRATVEVPNPGSTGEVRSRAEVATKARGAVGDVVRCHPAG